MSSNPYQTPDSKIDEEIDDGVEAPLSRSSGKKKLLIAIPAVAASGLLAYLGVLPGITRFLAVVLGAYAIVGLVEVIAGDSLVASAKKWDSMPGWKKFIISLVVIAAALTLFISLIPLVADMQ